MNDAAAVRARVLDLIGRGFDAPRNDAEFDDIALAVFAHQFAHNAPFRAFCERRGASPHTITRWQDIPAVPTAAFKEVALTTGDAATAQAVFRTSGTTRGAERRGTHYIADVSIYDASLLASFAACVLPDGVRPRMLSLIPTADAAPDSSLSHMASVVMRELGDTHSESFAHPDHGIDFDALDTAVGQACSAGAPVCVPGTAFAFVHWLDHLAERGRTFALPAGSRIMDTGGYKGRSREVPADELRELYAARLGVPHTHVVNEYGMTEMCSQFYDSTLRDHHAGIARPPRRIGPPWVRSRVVDPETLAPLPHGATGILQHHDLANVDSVSALQTEDLAIADAEGFTLLGRAPGAQPRGCSIAMDLLLEATGRRT